MLLQFSVKNHLCFAEEQCLSLVASKDDRHPEHLITARENYKHRALRVAALYGANAHGKTKLVESISFAQELIVDGRKREQVIQVRPFRLNPELLQQPSRFEFVFIQNNIEYTYGFVADKKRILEEWLFARPNSREVRYFERITKETGEIIIEFGHALLKSEQKQFLDFIIKGCQENQLFLTEAANRNVSTLEIVYEWFSKVLQVVSTDFPVQTIEACSEKDFISMTEFLNTAGTGISKIFLEEEPVEFMHNETDEKIRNMARDFTEFRINDRMIRLNDNKEPVIVQMKTQHENSDQELISFDLQEESSGTQRLIQILPIFFNLEFENKVYIIDELDRKLHPFLSKLFVQTFIKKAQASLNQLVFTTHETHLLDQDFLRRDEVWFVEKDRFGRSHLYSLADFKIRSDIKIEKGYLHGRFGAIPFVGNSSILD